MSWRGTGHGRQLFYRARMRLSNCVFNSYDNIQFFSPVQLSGDLNHNSRDFDWCFHHAGANPVSPVHKLGGGMGTETEDARVCPSTMPRSRKSSERGATIIEFAFS